MARKYDFNYGGARASYNQVGGVGQMVEQGLNRMADVTQKIQDEETRLVTDAAFAEWRATGEIPKDLDPKVNLEQFQGLINDSLMNDKLDEEISKYQYENSEAFRNWQKTNQENQLKLQEEQIAVARERAEIARQELSHRKSEGAANAARIDLLQQAAGSLVELQPQARQLAGQEVTDRFNTASLSNPRTAAKIKELIGVDPELDLMDPANAGALDQALDYMESSPLLMQDLSQDPEFTRAVAAATREKYGSLYNDWTRQNTLAAAGDRNTLSALGEMARLGGGLPGGGGLPVGGGGGGGGAGAVGGGLGASDPFTAVADQDIPRQALKDAGLSDSEIDGLEGYSGLTKRKLMEFSVNQRRDPTMDADQRAAEFERIKASSENEISIIKEVEDLRKNGTIPVNLKPTTSSFGNASSIDFVDSDQRSFDDAMGNTTFDFGKGSNMSALKWDKKETFANYLEKMIGDIDFDESDNADGGDRPIIDQLQNLYENNFQENADMFKHFFYTWAMDSDKREDVTFYKNNVANALPDETPETIRQYFENYKAKILEELGGGKKQVDGATAKKGAFIARQADLVDRL